MFTLNNYTEDDIDRLCDMDPDKALVVIGQRSLRLQGPRTTGYFQFKTIVLSPLSVARTPCSYRDSSQVTYGMLHVCTKDGQWLSNDASKVDEICQYKTPPTARLADVLMI